MKREKALKKIAELLTEEEIENIKESHENFRKEFELKDVNISESSKKEFSKIIAELLDNKNLERLEKTSFAEITREIREKDIDISREEINEIIHQLRDKKEE